MRGTTSTNKVVWYFFWPDISSINSEAPSMTAQYASRKSQPRNLPGWWSYHALYWAISEKTRGTAASDRPISPFHRALLRFLLCRRSMVFFRLGINSLRSSKPQPTNRPPQGPSGFALFHITPLFELHAPFAGSFSNNLLFSHHA